MASPSPWAGRTPALACPAAAPWASSASRPALERTPPRFLDSRGREALALLVHWGYRVRESRASAGLRSTLHEADEDLVREQPSPPGQRDAVAMPSQEA